jgi:hypothetical protein
VSSSNCKTCAVVELLQEVHGDYEAWATLADIGMTKPRFGWVHGNPEIVKFDLDKGVDDASGWYSDSAHPQGHEGQCYLVFKVQDEFWRIDGTTDSYANRTWKTLPYQVKAKAREVIVYELED